MINNQRGVLISSVFSTTRFPCGRINFQPLIFPLPGQLKNSDSFRASCQQKKMISAGQKKILRNYLPIEITAQHADTGKIMAGPLRGRLFDLSKNAACLLMSEIMDDTYHIFYSTQEDNLLFLNLFFGLPSAPDEQFNEHFKITAVPLWFNIFQQGQIRNFIMGVKFTRNIEEKIMRELLAGATRHGKEMS